MQSEDNQWMDPLLWELAADLGGAVSHTADTAARQHQLAVDAIPSPPDVQSVSHQIVQPNGLHPLPLAANGTMHMQLQPGQHAMAAVSQAQVAQLEHAVSLPASWGSGTNGVAGFITANHLHSHMACVAPAGLLHAQQMPLDYALAAAAANAAAAAARPSASHSPSSSSGGQQGDEYLELAEQGRGKKTLNKGALAQKRFRERQKVRACTICFACTCYMLMFYAYPACTLLLRILVVAWGSCKRFFCKRLGWCLGKFCCNAVSGSPAACAPRIYVCGQPAATETATPVCARLSACRSACARTSSRLLT
jgi:hypothetical protein